MEMYYVCCVHGFVRDTKFIHRDGQAIFECTPDVRTSKVFRSYKDAEVFMETTCNYKSHYCILRPADVRDD